MVKYCPNCGEQLVDNAKFCKNCGTDLGGTAPRAEVPKHPVYEKSYTIHIIAAYALALLIPLFGLILGVYLITRKDSESANRHGKYAIIIAIVLMAFSFFNVLRFY